MSSSRLEPRPVFVNPPLKERENWPLLFFPGEFQGRKLEGSVFSFLPKKGLGLEPKRGFRFRIEDSPFELLQQQKLVISTLGRKSCVRYEFALFWM